MVDLATHRIRTRIEAALLDAGAAQTHAFHGDRKRAAIGSMTGTVVEFGPGTGANMRYYADGVEVIAIEPNPGMHPFLREKAQANDVDLDLRTLRGEHVDVDDESADHVVATLVLCGVDDPAQVLREALRVLKPGGTYFFIEHVVSPHDDGVRLAQRILKQPHRWMFNGCEVDRDTASLLREAGFSSIEIEELDLGPKGVHIRHQVAGVAVK